MDNEKLIFLADKGIIEAQYLLGYKLFRGENGYRDKLRGMFWLKKAAEAGHKIANFVLGCIYYEEKTKIGYQRAIKWFIRSAERGYPFASYVLRIIYFLGKETETNHAKAEEHAKLAFESDSLEQKHKIVVLILLLQIKKLKDSGVDDEYLFKKFDLLGSFSPFRTKQYINALGRDSELVSALKEIYSNTCQICGEKLDMGEDQSYSEVHHIHPIGQPHNGPDVIQNMIVVCPSHHTMFDRGIISIDLINLTIIHRNPNNPLNGKAMILKHDIDEKYIQYHNNYIYIG